MIGIVNSNSPLVWDYRMTDALVAWAEANQAIAVTPFLLAGATSPVSLAEGSRSRSPRRFPASRWRSSCARRPLPVRVLLHPHGHAHRRSRVGTPEAVLAVLAGSQLAKRYGLPYRGGGGLASSNAVDAQAAAETTNTLWATLLAGTDVVLHAAGWLEGGLVASFEKFVLDVELLDSFALMRSGIGSSEEEMAFDAIAELGPGGLFLGSPHTMAHFKEWLTMSPLFTTPDFSTWETMGAERAEHRATALWKKLLDSYEDPGLDPAVDEELLAFMQRRRDDPPEPED